jgi:hypothetical protein
VLRASFFLAARTVLSLWDHLPVCAPEVCEAQASPEEVAAYRPALLDIVERFKATMQPLEERDTYGKAFLQIGNVWVDNLV